MTDIADQKADSVDDDRDRPVGPPQGDRLVYWDHELDRQHPVARHPAHADRPQPVLHVEITRIDRALGVLGDARRCRGVLLVVKLGDDNAKVPRLAGRRRHRDASNT